jgi:hypothetical protein
MALNDGQIPNPNVVRVAPGAGHHRVERNRRASRNGPVSDLSHPNKVTIRNFSPLSLANTGANARTMESRSEAEASRCAPAHATCMYF